LLRYIKKKELLDSIGAYYVSFQWLANQIDLLRLKLDEIHKGNARFFDSYVFQQMISTKIIGATSLGGQRTLSTNRCKSGSAFCRCKRYKYCHR
jgi:hypothetical protein